MSRKRLRRFSSRRQLPVRQALYARIPTLLYDMFVGCPTLQFIIPQNFVLSSFSLHFYRRYAIMKPRKCKEVSDTIHTTFNLDARYPVATLTTYVQSESSSPKIRPAMIVCPGGGYHGLANHEGEPIALFYLKHGFNAFVLHYGVSENATNSRPLIQAALAIRHVREHAAEYNVDPNRIFILGFSAGGHLAGSAGVLWNSPIVREALGINEENEGINRPDGMVLCYPVITALEYRHKGSFRNLLGTGTEEPDEEARRAWSLELHVDNTTPPAFLWHTVNDGGVPVQNSLLLGEALSRAGVSYEMHLFPDGRHGLGIPADRPDIAVWADLSATWAKNLGKQ